MKKIITVEGMACEHCVNAVKTALEELDGVKSAKVDLKKKTATVKSKNEISNESISNAIANAGFTVTGITVK